eukprot:CAMPEP_0113688258 /NCGR_PEP_ID=MMETSP0038_2-20120614/16419_1 /TAXON_ID=2898 /ORGANISM="Cryptomonas paramecium" /LENGTH=238 /DNA_ID=CAMNT_0000609019 /DNA_START=80 /DNA_END=792 /DNA_ORIENTATION=- /assembly_acc=CAM_ASM_000170
MTSEASRSVTYDELHPSNRPTAVPCVRNDPTLASPVMATGDFHRSSGAIHSPLPDIDETSAAELPAPAIRPPHPFASRDDITPIYNFMGKSSRSFRQSVGLETVDDGAEQTSGESVVKVSSRMLERIAMLETVFRIVTQSQRSLTGQLHTMSRAMARANAYTVLNTSTPVAAALCKRRYQAVMLGVAAVFAYWSVTETFARQNSGFTGTHFLLNVTSRSVAWGDASANVSAASATAVR